MKLSRSFLSDYVDIEDDTKSLAEKMTRIGNEYDSINKIANCTGLVIGEIIDAKPHPDSDHLNLCIVKVPEELNIVCGAPNVRKGLKVIVALDGAHLPGGEIKKTTIAGYESNGMICALSELGLDQKFLKKEDSEGIHELPNDAPIGEDAIKYLGYDDEIIDFELTANRADLLSILGLAYESAALYGKKVSLPQTDYKTIDENITDSYKLNIQTDNCYTFLAKKVKNVKMKESPSFIKNRLMASGIRPINVVVDISNYVMLETGQPLHYYDADRLGNVIGCKMAEDKEIVKTLDGNERTLTKNDIVIINGENKPVGLAGVMGGYDTEIEENTQNILIEAAIFNPINIRNTSKKYLRSEASIRFEKPLDVNRTYYALERSCYLLEKYAGGEVCDGLLEHNTLSKENKKINITLDKICSVLGLEISQNEVLEVFEKLGFKSNFSNNTFEVEVPSRRVDISIEEDLIEEVGRIYGVDNIQSHLPVFQSTPGKIDKRKRIIRDKMVSFGLNEVITYSLINEKDIFKFTNDEFGLIKVLDPMTEERVVLRHSILSSLLNVYDYNKARGIKDLNIFEIGKSFSSINGEYVEKYLLSALMTGEYTSGLGSKNYDFYYVKGIVESLLDHLGYKNRYTFEIREFPCEMHPTKSAYININGVIVGFFGSVHPNIYKEEVYVLEINLDTLFNIKTGKIKYKEFTKFPNITKDLAFICNKDITCQEIIQTIKQSAGKLLKNVHAFDYYEGDKIESNKKSIAFKLTFESFDKTLTEEEINPLIEKVIENVMKKHSAILRDK